MLAMHTPIYEARLRELVARIAPHLRPGDRVLDVGCGGGQLGAALMAQAPEGVVIVGLERFRRGGEPIEVHVYDGGAIPFEDASYDVVILADVLHHENDPDYLLSECRRVAKRFLIVKDHQLEGIAAWSRLSLIDWAANAPYGVKCLFRYNTHQQWQDSHKRHSLRPVEDLASMNLYPPMVNLLFGRRLQYLAVLGIEEPNGS